MKRPLMIYFVFTLAILANLTLWFSTRHVQAAWANVPPAPDKNGAGLLTLGDEQFSYRATGLMLQTLGNAGGRSEAIKDYNFDRLEEWFFLADRLDPHSDFMPMLAAYYYGASQDPSNLSYVIDYLEVVGQRPEGEKWRWLAHAVHLAKEKMKDNDRALDLAYKLAAIDNPDMAIWAKQMPAFLLKAKGSNEAAYEIMMGILASSADKLHPNEVNYMRDYICNTLLDEAAAGQNPLCREE